MKKRILVNFLYEEDKKLIQINYLTVITIFSFILLLVINMNLKFKTSKLEEYIEQNHKYTTVSNLDSNIDTNLIHISNTKDIVKLINNKNIQSIKISNNILNIMGYSENSTIIKSYIDSLNDIKELDNISIESINREGDRYSFEIEASIGYVNEI